MLFEEVHVRSVGDAVTRNIFQGFNVTILTSGQTCSGNTFTMSGSPEGDGHKRILPRAKDMQAGNSGDCSFPLAVTYIEIQTD